jgi:hypothetical protein
VLESDKPRKQALECMRLAADCENMADEVQSASLRAHFVGMAKVWSALADQNEALAPLQ